MTKQFQYEKQTFQEECVQNIVSIFGYLHQNQVFEKVMQVHHQKNNYPFPIIPENKNIDIMMETGTGKTFTFIQSMLELCKQFGYKKFIILIPTVPIREGTKTNLQDTKEYFKTIYANEREKEIQTYVYEDGNTSQVTQFINENRLSALIMTPASFSSKKNILNRPLEKEIHSPELYQEEKTPPKSYLEALKRLNPIIVMDEPHRFNGDAFRNYFEGFDNYYLRFGATFPKKNKSNIPLSNVAFTLDSISSFRQNLVKKIVVYTQDVLENTDTLIEIKKVGKQDKAIVQSLRNGISLKRELGVGDVYNGKSIRKILQSALFLSDDTKVEVDYELSEDAIRAMIRNTIEIHFEKEKELFENGIKALTLFFIKSDTSLFRGENPVVKTIFEEEYKKQWLIVNGQLANDDNYKKYLQNDFDTDGNLHVHKGYFSGDKGTNDTKIKAGVDEILKDKKKLLSFESPTRFIFSIWALQEGWDNPNVFTICKLSNQGSEISKLQQIGRGLRICVGQNLKRKTLQSFHGNQEEFWNVNNLDVVVSSKEQGFVQAIQNEILANSFFINNVFSEQELKRLLQEKNNFDDNTVRRLFKVLENKELILFKEMVDGQDIYEKSPDYSLLINELDLPKNEQDALKNLFAFDGNSYAQDGNQKKEKKKVYIKNQHLESFRQMWNKLNKKSFYTIENLDAIQKSDLLQSIKVEIENLEIEKIILQTLREELKMDRLEEADAIYGEVIGNLTHQNKVDYLTFVQTLATETKTPLSFVIEVFNNISDDFRNTMLVNNPKLALAEMVKIIQKHLVKAIRTQVKYDGIEGSILPDVFRTETSTSSVDYGKTYLDKGSIGKFQKDISQQEFSLKEKWIFEEVIEFDSEFEVEIIEQDPNMTAIEIFGKLPRLRIQTPLGEYNPDFCYTIKSSDGKQLILVVEAKGYDTSTDIPENEKRKIEFAKIYFEKLNAYYQKQNSNIQIRYTERIRKAQLASLITEI